MNKLICIIILLSFVSCSKKSETRNEDTLTSTTNPTPQRPTSTSDKWTISCVMAKKIVSHLNSRVVELSRSDISLDEQSKEFQFQLGLSVGSFLKSHSSINIEKDDLIKNIINPYNTSLRSTYLLRKALKDDLNKSELEFTEEMNLQVMKALKSLSKKEMSCFKTK